MALNHACLPNSTTWASIATGHLNSERPDVVNQKKSILSTSVQAEELPEMPAHSWIIFWITPHIPRGAPSRPRMQDCISSTMTVAPSLRRNSFRYRSE